MSTHTLSSTVGGVIRLPAAGFTHEVAKSKGAFPDTLDTIISTEVQRRISLVISLGMQMFRAREEKEAVDNCGVLADLPYNSYMYTHR